MQSQGWLRDGTGSSLGCEVCPSVLPDTGAGTLCPVVWTTWSNTARATPLPFFSLFSPSHLLHKEVPVMTKVQGRQEMETES